MKYVVYGGEYTDTTFSTIVDGKDEFYGPFDDYGKARVVWFEKTCKNVDNCHHRMRVYKADVNEDGTVSFNIDVSGSVTPIRKAA